MYLTAFHYLAGPRAVPLNNDPDIGNSHVNDSCEQWQVHFEKQQLLS
jgi:hypothetical protein